MIIGLGLPRTGTSSLADALRILGYRGHSWCALHGEGETDHDWDVLRLRGVRPSSLPTFYIDNSVWKELDILRIDREFKYILTTRESASHAESMAKHTKTPSCGKVIVPAALPNILEYHSRVLQRIPEENLLVVDWTTGDGWPELCEFLGQEIPDEEFPCKRC